MPISDSWGWKGHFIPLPIGHNGMFYWWMLHYESPALRLRLSLFLETNAGTVGCRNSKREGGTNVLLPLPPPTLSTFTPFLTHPRRAGLVHLSVLSWEEVPSHLTLRKWFQCMLVWILAGFCNCQFPYQSVGISIGRTWATSPLPLAVLFW